jgi:hypothetical protein
MELLESVAIGQHQPADTSVVSIDNELAQRTSRGLRSASAEQVNVSATASQAQTIAFLVR